jgi:hypothetical protein
MTRGFAWFAIAAAMSVACGGASGATRPKPLQYHFKEQYLTKVPPEERADMKAALAEYNRAKQENHRAETEYADSKSKLEQAKGEASKAHGQKESADSQREKAEEGKDNFNQVNMAKRDQRVAEVTQRAADKKVDMLEARKSYLDKWVRYSREYVFVAEAKYELAKANTARAHNIAPPDFAYQAYVDQYERRRAKADKLKGPVDGAKESWLAEKKEYDARRRDEMEARGIDTAATAPDADQRENKKK